MVAQTDIPSDLTDSDKALLFQILDAQLNSGILNALLYGGQQHLMSLHVGVDWYQAYTLAFSLSHCGIYVSQEHLLYDTQAEINGIVINKCWPIRQAVVVIIILLHALITINFAANWSFIHFAFIENGQNYWTVYLIFQSTNAATWVFDIAAAISTILADLYMVCAILLGIIHISSPLFQHEIWCCWMVWGHRWLVVLHPISCLVSAISMVSILFMLIVIINLLCSIKSHNSILWQCQSGIPTLEHIHNALYIPQPGDNIILHLAHHIPHCGCCWY